MQLTEQDKARVADAIKHFSALQRRYTTQHNGTACEHVRLALEGLRRMAAQDGIDENKCLNRTARCMHQYDMVVPMCTMRWNKDGACKIARMDADAPERGREGEQ